MNWFNKKQAESKQTIVSKELFAIDYPKDKYKVYWETHIQEVADGTWSAEIRFIGYSATPHRSQHNVYGPTKENVEQNSTKLILEKMNSFRK